MRILLFVPAILLAIGATSCTMRPQPTTGESVRQIMAAQKAAPLPVPPTAVEGMDGAKGAEVMKNYRKTEKTALESQVSGGGGSVNLQIN